MSAPWLSLCPAQGSRQCWPSSLEGLWTQEEVQRAPFAGLPAAAASADCPTRPADPAGSLVLGELVCPAGRFHPPDTDPANGPACWGPSLLLCQSCLRPPMAPAADCRRTSSKLFPRGHLFLPCTLDHRIQLPSLVWPAAGHLTLPARSSRTGAEFVAAGSPAQSTRKNVANDLLLGV